MISRILVAVDDSPAAMAALRYAIEFAAAVGATLRIVHVVTDGELNDLLWREAAAAAVATRREESAGSLLRHVEKVARQTGISVETSQLYGEPARCILAQARSWPADLIVLGRSDVLGAGRPYVGHETRHVLEFTEQPVLVVPPSHPAAG